MATKFWLVLVIAIVAVGALVCGCGEDSEDTSRMSAGSSAAPHDSTLVAPSPGATEAPGAIADTAVPVLLDLGADKCVPSKMMAPILDEMRETFAGQLDVRFIDVWKNASAGREHGVKVIPTQIFFDEEGNELFRHQGFFSREDMLAKWVELGYAFAE